MKGAIGLPGPTSWTNALETLLATGEFMMSDLLEIYLVNTDATPIPKLTNAPEDTVVYCGGTRYGLHEERFFSRLIGFSRGSTTIQYGLAATTLDVTLWPVEGGLTTYGGVPIMQALRNGLLDGAGIVLSRQYWDANIGIGFSDYLTDSTTIPVAVPTIYQIVPYPVWLFSGRVSEVRCSSNKCDLTVTSDLELLDRPMPKNLYQPMCNKSFGLPSCGVAIVATPITAVTGSTIADVLIDDATGAIYDLDRYSQGVITCTTGPNAGARRTIRTTSTDGTHTHFVPIKPFPYTPLNGNTYSVTPGCDRTLGPGGCAKFSNQNRFRGMPWIPRAETTR